MKTLTIDQIKEIKDFIISKDVKYYEIIEELTDHLASSIEDKWSEGNNNNLEYLLAKEYENFGSYKFLSIQESREKQKFREYKHMFFKSLKEFFTFPLIVTVIAIILLIAALLHWIGQEFKFLTMIFIMSPVIVFFYSYAKDLVLRKKVKTKLLLDRTYSSVMSFSLLSNTIFFNIIMQGKRLFNLPTTYDSIGDCLLMASGITLTILSIYVGLNIIKPTYQNERDRILKTIN
ncbi:hypothetical protein HMPREF9713_00258 [Myroides odoratimimus CCUG 12700]|uniref:hypothetical protein n=1 Tax=Myroides odoratimimus TaxID=76832 RepID=UPI000353AA73|nr:hypothetical protein [Myroides odoratimimus]EPH14058.1 hypothetical protein HMPREF9713_00258 [Myroides odoratimimus CCUG 12700]